MVLSSAPNKMATECVMSEQLDVFCTLTLIYLMVMYSLRSRWRLIIHTLPMKDTVEVKELKRFPS